MNDLNNRSTLNAVEIMDALTDSDSCSQHLETWDLYVARNGGVELARIELTIHGIFIVENFIHANMEINNYYIPPFNWVNDVLALIAIQARIYFGKNFN